MQAHRVDRKKLLVICGPTATGKTNLALRLAKKFNGDIVCADSRQIFKGMDIGTGKDLPENSKSFISNIKLGRRRIGCHRVDRVRIWGLDLVDPREEFSVADYVKHVSKILNVLERSGRLPILVGGTGLYIKAVVDGIGTIAIPPNKSLRFSLSKKTATELFEILAQLDAIKAGLMNLSDRKNPRRLIRAIEVAMSGKKGGEKGRAFVGDVLLVGLFASKEVLRKRIHERVALRFKEGVVLEIEGLFKRGVSWDSQAMSGLGYRQWRGYFEGKKEVPQILKAWEQGEVDYAKRQMVWFGRDERVNWFDITKKDFDEEVEDVIRRWYYLK